MKPFDSISSILTHYREVRGINQSSMSTVYGVKPSQVSIWEKKAKNKFTITSLVKIAEALGQDLSITLGDCTVSLYQTASGGAAPATEPSASQDTQESGNVEVSEDAPVWIDNATTD